VTIPVQDDAVSEANADELQAGLTALNIVANAKQVQQLLQYLNLLVKWNASFNLSGITDINDMVSVHLLDSLSLSPHLHGNHFVDAGTGAGLPGIPLAILHALGGMRATMAESMLVFAPHANSWRRFSSQSYAPVAANWGVNNRSVALRIPAGSVAARRIEHRPSGVDANPYLVAATVLAALRHGLQRQLDPGPVTTGNGYEESGSVGMPRDWRSAIEAAEKSDFLKSALGSDMHRTFVSVKAAEYARVARTISDVDYDLYLHTV